MGYKLHITRAPDYAESDEVPITLEEWLGYLGSDPEMELMEPPRADTAGGTTLRIASPGLAVWTGYARDCVDGARAWFDYADGQIVVRTLTNDVIAKALRIAGALQAKVQGDEGDEWSESDLPPYPPYPKHGP